MTKSQVSMWGDGYQVWLCDHLTISIISINCGPASLTRLVTSSVTCVTKPIHHLWHVKQPYATIAIPWPYPQSTHFLTISSPSLCDYIHPLCDHTHPLCDHISTPCVSCPLPLSPPVPSAGVRQWSAFLLLVWKQTKSLKLVCLWSSFCWKVYFFWISHKITMKKP